MKKGTTLRAIGKIPEQTEGEYKETIMETTNEIIVIEKVQQKKARLIVTEKDNSEGKETFTGFIKVDGEIFPCAGYKKIEEETYFIDI